jgi:peptidoglycan DL-endopeptidase CwlO
VSARSFLSGVLGLIALEVVVSDERAYGQLGGAAVAASGAVTWLLSPYAPAIPDRRQAGAPTTPAAALAGTLGRSVPIGADAAGSSTSPAGVTAAVIDAAMSALGDPYTFDTQGQIGADGRRHFDCSGLVSWAYKAAGIDLVPSSFTQAKAGNAVQAAPPFVRAGDLIFTRDSEGRTDGHVGIAVDGSTWVTAPHTGAVVHVSPIPWADVTSNVASGGAGVRRVIS